MKQTFEEWWNQLRRDDSGFYRPTKALWEELQIVKEELQGHPQSKDHYHHKLKVSTAANEELLKELKELKLGNINRSNNFDEELQKRYVVQAEVEQAEEERDKANEKLTAVKEELQAAKAEQHRLRTAMGIAHAEVGEYRQSEASVVSQEQDTHEKLAKLEDERDEAITARNNARDDRDKAETALDFTVKTLRADLEQTKDERDANETLRKRAREEADSFQARLVQQGRELDSALEELKLLHDTKNDTTTVTDNVVALRQTVCELRADLDGASKCEAQLRKRLCTAENQVYVLRVAQEQDTHEKLTAVRAKLKAAEADRDMERLNNHLLKQTFLTAADPASAWEREDAQRLSELEHTMPLALKRLDNHAGRITDLEAEEAEQLSREIPTKPDVPVDIMANPLIPSWQHVQELIARTNFLLARERDRV